MNAYSNVISIDPVGELVNWNAASLCCVVGCRRLSWIVDRGCLLSAVGFEEESQIKSNQNGNFK
jgi:hypothetical protein